MANEIFVDGFDKVCAEAIKHGGTAVRANVNSALTLVGGQTIVLGVLSKSTGRLEPILLGELTRSLRRGNMAVGFFVVPSDTQIVGGE